DARLIAQAVGEVRAADVSILVLGGNEDTNKEGWADSHLGDRDSLDLVGRQNDLVKAVLETGKPTIVLVIGRGRVAEWLTCFSEITTRRASFRSAFRVQWDSYLSITTASQQRSAVICSP